MSVDRVFIDKPDILANVNIPGLKEGQEHGNGLGDSIDNRMRVLRTADGGEGRHGLYRGDFEHMSGVYPQALPGLRRRAFIVVVHSVICNTYRFVK